MKKIICSQNENGWGAICPFCLVDNYYTDEDTISECGHFCGETEDGKYFLFD